jgi:hypothetical protein
VASGKTLVSALVIVGLVSPPNPGLAARTVIRSSVVRENVTRAGFTTTTVLPVERPQFHLYHLEV